MSNGTAVEVAREFWRLMATNDFHSEAASDVTVTDGVRTARAISFFTVAEGKVTRLVEFWPEPYAAPGNRVHLVEAME
jgi:hypothetical protein